MSDDTMPRNLVGHENTHDGQSLAQHTDISEKAWRAQNLPAQPLTLRWRYTNRQIPLFERRLRSLAGYHVGPALQAWIRSRLDWIVDNKLRARPDGVVVLTVDTEGNVDIMLEALGKLPAFTPDALRWRQDALVGSALAGTLWAASNDTVCAIGVDSIDAAADTFVRDLAQTLGLEYVTRGFTCADIEGTELFVVNDEHGVVVCEGYTGPISAKLSECFDKLWSLE